MALFFKRLRQRFLGSGQPSKQIRPPRPPRPPRRSSAPAYVLVVDESASTGCPFRMSGRRTTSRIASIQSAAREYLHRLRDANPAQRVAVVGFSETARLYQGFVPVGRGFRGLSSAVGALHPQSNTNLSAGLALALDHLCRSGVRRGNVVVITDGAANVARDRLPDLVRRAKASRIRIYTIGVGNNADTDYDRDLLVWMARTTGGRFASAHSFGQLCRALRQVA